MKNFFGKMFDNVDEKLKKISMYVFIVVAVLMIVYGFYVMIAGFVAAYNFGEGILYFFLALIVMAAGIFAAYVSSLMTYGFAELITNTKKEKVVEEPAKEEKVVAENEENK